MPFIRFMGWLALLSTGLAAIGAIVHVIFLELFPLVAVSANRATAGAYSMEVLVSAIAFVLVMWRILWALETAKTMSKVWALLKNRTAILSMSLGGLVGMIFVNRVYWWFQHMFTDKAFNQYTYTSAANSVIVAFMLCALSYSLYATPNSNEDFDDHSPNGLMVAATLWGFGVVAFVVGTSMYSGRP